MNNDKCIVIPAAGSSSRLGRPKQLVEFKGRSLIRRAVETSLEASSTVIVVTGCEDTAVRGALNGLPIQVVDNPVWEKGMGKSIAVGVKAALDRNHEIEGILIHLCDLPTIDADHLSKLLSSHSRSNADLVYTKYEDCVGVPALFGRRYFDDLLLLDSDRGAKHLIDEEDDAEKEFVEFEGKFLDVDLPGDLGDSDESY